MCSKHHQPVSTGKKSFVDRTMRRKGIVDTGPMIAVICVATSIYLRTNEIPGWLLIDFFTKDPAILSQSFLVSIILIVISLKIWQKGVTKSQEIKKDTQAPTKSKSIRELQWRFLTVFWLLRVTFWMAGPYFYAAFASKTTPQGQPMNVRTISQISLTGYAAIALLGPLVGKIMQSHGMRVGTMVGMLFYGLGSISVAAESLSLLFLGRVSAGIGQSILSNAPESWFISESKHKDRDPRGLYLGETFGLAYSLDSVVAIIAGQLAEWAASSGGPTAPFSYSPFFLIVGFFFVSLLWSESPRSMDISIRAPSPVHNHSIQDAIRIIFADPKIIGLGVVQSFFEAAMYIFVLAWAPLMEKTIHASFGDSVAIPYGKVFSSFMAASMLGSTLFSILVKRLRLELVVIILLAAASLSLVSSLWSISHTTSSSWTVLQLFLSYLGFEVCVGMYFPSSGTLRASILPDSHRSVIMTLFAVPLNAMVVIVFLLLDKLGHRGGMTVAAAAVGVATIAMLWLDRQMRLDRRKQTRARFQKMANKVKLVNTICMEFNSRLGGNGQMYMVNGRFSRRESKSTFASLNAPM